MLSLIVIVSLLKVTLAAYVSVQMPYPNPADVTYINGDYQSHEIPFSYHGASIGQSQLPEARATHIESHQHVGYTSAQIPGVAAVPYVQHLPTVSNIPVTRYEAQPAILEKQIDIAKPAIATRKYEVRRPAIQKQFYDIEERVIVRPAGSAVVELDEPTSKIQKGAAIVESLSEVSGVPPFGHNIVAHASSFADATSGPTAIPFIAHAPVHVTVAPVISHSPVSNYQQLRPSESTPIAAQVAENESSQAERNEAVVVENADYRRTQFQDNSIRRNENDGAVTRTAQQEEQQQQQQQQQEYEKNSRNYEQHSRLQSTPNVDVQSNGADASARRFIAHDPSTTLIARTQSSSEENINNQRRLIDLLTARGGVTEVGFGREGSAESSLTNAGQIRARVISATPAPESAEPTGERVSTRRVVFSRPIETLEEVNVSEAGTKLERVSVQHPTYIHSQRLDHIQVHGSVPVVGKALTPTITHANVPVYQKTISSAYHF